MYTRYIFIFIIFSAVIALSKYVIFASFRSAGILKYLYVEKILLMLAIIMPLAFIFSMIYGNKHFSLLNSWLYIASAVWFSILVYIFFAAVVIILLIFFNSYFNLNLPIQSISFILIACAFATTAYGIYNTNHPRIVRYEVTSPTLAPLWQGKKIVIISDVHLGDIYREKFMKKIVDIINKEKPDITFNLGDLIDGPSFPYEKGFAPLYELNPPLGNFYVEGNHERYGGEYDLFKSYFPKNLNDITGKKIMINNTQIIGLPYMVFASGDQTNKELAAVSYDKKIPSIILMHDPKDTPTLALNNASLVLSGHTHAGQFFPFTLFINKIYGKYVHGIIYTRDTASITSSGIGTAIAPIRVGTIPEIIVLTIVPR